MSEGISKTPLRVYRVPSNVHKAEVYIQLIAFPSHTNSNLRKNLPEAKAGQVADKTKLY